MRPHKRNKQKNKKKQKIKQYRSLTSVMSLLTDEGIRNYFQTHPPGGGFHIPLIFSILEKEDITNKGSPSWNYFKYLKYPECKQIIPHFVVSYFFLFLKLIYLFN